MMRKWILAGLGAVLVLLFAFGADAVLITNETVATGTSVIRIQALRGSYKTLTVHPYSETVIVTIYDNGAALETFDVEAGAWRTAYIAGRDSVQIARATTTAVDWSISPNDKAYVGGASGSTPDLTVTNVLTSTGLGEGESVDVELGDISGYWEVYIKIEATTAAAESVSVYFGSSEDATWATGNTAYFDYDPSTTVIDPKWLSATYDEYGDCIAIVNSFGAWLPGPFGLLTIKNENTNDDDVGGMTVELIKRK